MGSGKQIANGVLWTTVYNIVGAVYGFVSIPLLIAYFGKGNYGLIGLAMSVNVYLRLMDLGFNSTTVRYFSDFLSKGESTKVRQLFQTSLAFYGSIGLVNALVLLLLSFFSATVFHLSPMQDVVMRHLLYILSISAFISWFTSCFEQLIKAHERVDWMQRLYLLPKLSQILVLGGTLLLGLSIEAYYALTAFSMFWVIPFAVRKIRNLAPYVSFHPRFHLPMLREILPYCLSLFSFGIFQFSLQYLRPVILGVRCGVEDVAEYNVLNGVITAVMLLGGAFLGVFLPSAAKAVSLGDKQAQDRIAYDGTRYICLTLALCCFGLMATSREVLTLYVGEAYLHLDAWLCLWLLFTLTVHNQAISSLILAGTDIRAITWATIISSVVGLALCWALTPSLRVGGTVVGLLVYGLGQLLFFYFYYWPRRMGISSRRVFSAALLPSVLSGAAAMAAVRWGMAPFLLGMAPLWRFLILGATFLLLYMILTSLWLPRKDVRFLLAKLRGR